MILYFTLNSLRTLCVAAGSFSLRSVLNRSALTYAITEEAVTVSQYNDAK